MSNGATNNRMLAGATYILAACAIAMTVLLARRAFEPAHPLSAMPFERQNDWETYARDGRRLGSADARALLVTFSDFQCPACRGLAARLQQTLRRYPDEFAVVYRHWPLPHHKQSRAAALASECAARQGRFAEIHDLFFDSQDALGVRPWKEFAREAGVRDLETFTTCLESQDASEVVERDMEAAQRLRLRGTPTVLVNGVRFTGALDQQTLDSLVANALKKSRK